MIVIMNNENENVKRQYYHYIYKIVFLKGEPEGRYYLGKRTYFGISIDKDSYTGSGLFCIAYFKKYGAIDGETYLKEIIEINTSVKENKLREDFWIGDKYKTDPLCMNLVAGGSGCPNHDTNCYVQDKYKKDISQYDLYGNFIRTWHGIREAARELGVNRTGIQNCISGRKPSAFGYQWKYSDGGEEPIEPFYKILPIKQYTRAGEFVADFDSPYDAEMKIKIDAGSIKDVCDGKRVSAGDYIWRYKKDSFDKYRTTLINYKDRNIEYKKKIRPVLAYYKTGEFVKEFKNISEAIEWLNKGDSSMIYQVINRKRKSAYGYIWKFKENEEELCQR